MIEEEFTVYLTVTLKAFSRTQAEGMVQGSINKDEEYTGEIEILDYNRMEDKMNHYCE